MRSYLLDGCAFPIIRKCASKVLTTELRQLGAQQVDAVPYDHRVIVFLRHPVARLMSVYRSFVGRGSLRAVSLYGIPGVRRHMLFSDFVNLVCATDDSLSLDKHLRSQSSYFDVADELFRVEALAEDWSRLQRRFGFGVLPYHRTQSWNVRDTDSIRRRYAHDWVLWNEIPLHE